ncbi:hypothetical protein IGJ29_000421 [Enterococcus sp. DIV2461a]
MNRNKNLFIYIGIIFLLGIFGIILFRGTMFSYQKNVSNFSVIHPNSINNLREGSIIYIGRKTCPTCVSFVPKLTDTIGKKEYGSYTRNTDRLFAII